MAPNLSSPLLETATHPPLSLCTLDGWHSPKMRLSGPAAIAHPASRRPRPLLGPLNSYGHQPAFRVFPDAVLHVVALCQGLPLLSVLLIVVCVLGGEGVGHVGIRGTDVRQCWGRLPRLTYPKNVALARLRRRPLYTTMSRSSWNNC